MMTRTLTENDITLIKNEVSDELSAHVKSKMSTSGQAFGVEILAEIVSKVILPILVSVCSKALYDVLKGKALSSLKKKQADRLSGELIGAELHDTRQLDETCMAEIKRELLPLGLTEEDIQEIFEKIRQKLQQSDGLAAQALD